MSRLRTAVVLSAGYGTRLLPLTASVPKVMLPVAGKPLVEQHMLRFAAAGITDVCINLHAHPAVIRDHFGDGSRFGVRVHYAFEPELRGTSGALNGFHQMLSERFLVQYGDVYSQLDIAAMDEFHVHAGSAASIAVHPTSHPHDSDIVESDGMNVVALHHKPGSSRYGALGNAGCYIVEPVALSFLSADGPSDFVQDLFPAMLRAGLRVMAYETDDLLFDMGTPDRYQALAARLRMT